LEMARVHENPRIFPCWQGIRGGDRFDRGCFHHHATARDVPTL
jgi:hypothetical protein